MDSNKYKMCKMFVTLTLLTYLWSAVALNIDCGGKPFHCFNSTHFMICVDLGGGVSKTVDHFMIHCPPPTLCSESNQYECEYQLETIANSISSPEGKTNNTSVNTITTVLNEFANTNSPFQENNDTRLFNEYYNTIETTTKTDTKIYQQNENSTNLETLANYNKETSTNNDDNFEYFRTTTEIYTIENLLPKYPEISDQNSINDLDYTMTLTDVKLGQDGNLPDTKQKQVSSERLFIADNKSEKIISDITAFNSDSFVIESINNLLIEATTETAGKDVFLVTAHAAITENVLTDDINLKTSTEAYVVGNPLLNHTNMLILNSSNTMDHAMSLTDEKLLQQDSSSLSSAKLEHVISEDSFITEMTTDISNMINTSKSTTVKGNQPVIESTGFSIDTTTEMTSKNESILINRERIAADFVNKNNIYKVTTETNAVDNLQSNIGDIIDQNGRKYLDYTTPSSNGKLIHQDTRISLSKKSEEITTEQSLKADTISSTSNDINISSNKFLLDLTTETASKYQSISTTEKAITNSFSTEQTTQETMSKNSDIITKHPAKYIQDFSTTQSPLHTDYPLFLKSYFLKNSSPSFMSGNSISVNTLGTQLENKNTSNDSSSVSESKIQSTPELNLVGLAKELNTSHVTKLKSVPFDTSNYMFNATYLLSKDNFTTLQSTLVPTIIPSENVTDATESITVSTYLNINNTLLFQGQNETLMSPEIELNSSAINSKEHRIIEDIVSKSAFNETLSLFDFITPSKVSMLKLTESNKITQSFLTDLNLTHHKTNSKGVPEKFTTFNNNLEVGAASIVSNSKSLSYNISDMQKLDGSETDTKPGFKVDNITVKPINFIPVLNSTEESIEVTTKVAQIITAEILEGNLIQTKYPNISVTIDNGSLNIEEHTLRDEKNSMFSQQDEYKSEIIYTKIDNGNSRVNISLLFSNENSTTVPMTSRLEKPFTTTQYVQDNIEGTEHTTESNNNFINKTYFIKYGNKSSIIPKIGDNYYVTEPTENRHIDKFVIDGISTPKIEISKVKIGSKAGIQTEKYNNNSENTKQLTTNLSFLKDTQLIELPNDVEVKKNPVNHYFVNAEKVTLDIKTNELTSIAPDFTTVVTFNNITEFEIIRNEPVNKSGSLDQDLNTSTTLLSEDQGISWLDIIRTSTETPITTKNDSSKLNFIHELLDPVETSTATSNISSNDNEKRYMNQVTPVTQIDDIYKNKYSTDAITNNPLSISNNMRVRLQSPIITESPVWEGYNQSITESWGTSYSNELRKSEFLTTTVSTINQILLAQEQITNEGANNIPLKIDNKNLLINVNNIGIQNISRHINDNVFINTTRPFTQNEADIIINTEKIYKSVRTNGVESTNIFNEEVIKNTVNPHMRSYEFSTTLANNKSEQFNTSESDNLGSQHSTEVPREVVDKITSPYRFSERIIPHNSNDFIYKQSNITSVYFPKQNTTAKNDILTHNNLTNTKPTLMSSFQTKDNNNMLKKIKDRIPYKSSVLVNTETTSYVPINSEKSSNLDIYRSIHIKENISLGGEGPLESTTPYSMIITSTLNTDFKSSSTVAVEITDDSYLKSNGVKNTLYEQNSTETAFYKELRNDSIISFLKNVTSKQEINNIRANVNNTIVNNKQKTDKTKKTLESYLESHTTELYQKPAIIRQVNLNSSYYRNFTHIQKEDGSGSKSFYVSKKHAMIQSLNEDGNIKRTEPRVTSIINKRNVSIDNVENKDSINGTRFKNFNRFTCKNRLRGRYADTNNCRKYYICIGRNQPLLGECPADTVFSEIKKQCTKNLSHCIRNNQFRCAQKGRFSDVLRNNVYYVCVNYNNSYIRFQFQCQKGFHLNKATVRCINDIKLQTHMTSMSIDSDSNKASDQSTVEGKSKEKKQGEEKTKTYICKEEGKFPDTEDCRRYYVCSKNSKSVFRRRTKKCESDEVFHREKKKCVGADSYECN